MGTVHNIDDAYAWSISKIAEAFGLDRRTVSARIKETHLIPVDYRKGHPVFHLKDIGPALFAESAFGSKSGVDAEFSDPTKMFPKDRKDWFDSERSRLKVEQDMKLLCPAADVARSFADLVKAVVNPLDSLIDTLESKAGLTGDALDRVQNIVDSCREQMYLNAMRGGAAHDDTEVKDEDE